MIDFKKDAREFDRRFGGTDGCAEKAYLAGARDALMKAQQLCTSGAAPSMIRVIMSRWIEKIEGKKDEAS